MPVYSNDYKYKKSDLWLAMFHQSRNNPMKVKAIRNSCCYGGFGKMIKKGETVVIEGTISECGRFQVSVPSECGFYPYEDFEPAGD